MGYLGSEVILTIPKGAFFECPQYGDEDGLIPDDIAYHGAACPHYQPKK